MHWQARMWSGFSAPGEVERNLELIRSRFMTSSDAWDRWLFLLTMAEATFLRGRFDAAMQLLNQAYDAVDGDFMLTLIVLYHQAALASVQGNYVFSRSRLQHTLDTLDVVATPSSTGFLQMRYVHGRNELYAKDYPEARRLLVAVIADCDISGNIGVKMSSMRVLGEVQLLLECKSDSDHSFAQTVELCNEAGMPLELLDASKPLLKINNDEEFPGWRTYLRARAGP
ncbi:hypothetical protein JVU11DRAFT_2200 [Chiua virens]|nr:hypothetical protein JVU11DRAFT_2200 [Chiua virens]